MGLIDPYGRTINYLRLSVTDRCNMRCLYCMPASGVTSIPHETILRYEELLMIARTAVGLGIEKIRVTGGEPLVRRGITGFLQSLSRIPGLKQLVLTTNGLNLCGMAEELMQAGVQRLNISLDSLRPETFAHVTRGASLQRVLDGIEAARLAGFPVKVNMVVMRGINDDELLDFASMTLEKRIMVRFIEYMPATRENDWQTRVVPGSEILERIGRRFSLIPGEQDKSAGPARIYNIDGAAGSLGVITPISGHFCGECNRIRVTSTGAARSCLFSDAQLNLKPWLESGDEAGLAAALRSFVLHKPGTHHLAAAQQTHTAFTMAAIGG